MHYYYGLCVFEALRRRDHEFDGICQMEGVRVPGRGFYTNGICSCCTSIRSRLHRRLINESVALMSKDGVDEDEVLVIVNIDMPRLMILIDQYFGRGEGDRLRTMVYAIYREAEIIMEEMMF